MYVAFGFGNQRLQHWISCGNTEIFILLLGASVSVLVLGLCVLKCHVKKFPDLESGKGRKLCSMCKSSFVSPVCEMMDVFPGRRHLLSSCAVLDLL